MAESGIAPQDVKGIGFDATCSLAVLAEDTDRPVSVCGPEFVEHTRNVICEDSLARSIAIAALAMYVD